jgi:FkbM family methyltransferase
VREEKDLVFDVGAHVGDDSDFYLKLGFRVVAVEANPGLAAGLRQRFAAEIDSGRYVLVDKAIGSGHEPIKFFVNRKTSVWGTADPSWALRNRRLGAESDEISVPSVPFTDLLQTYGCPYYLKIDIQGADMLCVTALESAGCSPTYISIASSKTSWRGLLKEFDALERLRYTRFKVVNQGTHKPGRFTTRNGTQLAYAFEAGASGPFGADLAGKWLTRSRAIMKYVPIFLMYKSMGDNTFLDRHAGTVRRIPILEGLMGRVSWYDTHATRSPG